MKKQLKRDLCRKELKRQHLMVVLSILLIISAISQPSSAAVQEQAPTITEQIGEQPIRVRVYNLRNITVQQVKDYLQAAKLEETVLAIPQTNAISVTANAEELVWTSTIIKLVDSNEKFDIKFLDIPAGNQAPGTDKIEKELGKGYSIGTLLDGPSGGGVVKAVVCPYKDKLLVIAPEEQTEKITQAVQKSFAGKPKTEPNQTVSIQQAEPNQQNMQINAVQDNNAAAHTIKFAKEPVIIEANTTAATAKEPNKPEDEMMNGFINELNNTTKTTDLNASANQEPDLNAKAQREAAIARAEAAKAKADKMTIAQIPTESPENAIAKQTPEPNAAKEADQKIQQAARLKKKFSNQPQTTVKEAQQSQPWEPGETDNFVEVGREPKVVPEINIPNGDELLELNLPEKLELVALIDLVGKYLNLNYLYDETKVTGSVTIKVQGKLRVRELYNLLESVLKFRGFAMSRKGRLVTIVPTTEALDQDPAFLERMKAGDVVTTSVFHLKYITTANARKLLGEMKLGYNITELPETGTLVITDYAFRMQRIEDLLALVDMPGPPREFKLRVLNYTIAEVLVPKIQALAEQLGTVDVTIGPSAQASATQQQGPSRIRRPQPTVPQPQPQTGEAAKKTGVFIDFDKRTNRILMIGLPNELAAVQQIIDTLDVPQQDLRVIREYEIQYVDIDKVVEALGQFGIIVSTGTTEGTVPKRSTIISPGQQPQPPTAAPAVQTGTTGEALISLDQPQVVKLESTNSLLINATPEQQMEIARIISYIDREPVEAAIPYRIYRLENQEPEALAEVLNNLIEKTVKDKEGKIQQTIKYTEENIAIVPDKNTFSLIVYASKKNQEWIGNLIKSLDKRRPQVLIDVSLVEITRDDVFNYDLDIVSNLKGSDVTGNLEATPILSTATGRHDELGWVGGATGTITGFFTTKEIQALLTLVNTKGYGRILARPKILVNDNEKGTISTEDTRYVTNISTTALAGTATAPATGAVQSSVSFNPYVAKIELDITPQISEGDLLRLEIKMQRNDFVGDGTTITLADGTKTISPPNQKTSNVDTIVTVPDGSTIILGGLIKLNQAKSGSKVPLLGDVPIVGALFSSYDKAIHDDKLYIFVKANIIRPEDTQGIRQINQISKKNRREFEKDESKFQDYQEIPGIKPEPIEPRRVLEQQ